MFVSLKMDVSGFVCLKDFEREAKQILPRNALNYYKSGADDEITLSENAAAFKRFLPLI